MIVTFCFIRASFICTEKSKPLYVKRSSVTRQLFLNALDIFLCFYVDPETFSETDFETQHTVSHTVHQSYINYVLELDRMPFYFKYMHCKKKKKIYIYIYIYIYKLIYVYMFACFCFAHSFLCQTNKKIKISGQVGKCWNSFEFRCLSPLRIPAQARTVQTGKEPQKWRLPPLPFVCRRLVMNKRLSYLCLEFKTNYPKYKHS